MSHLPVAGFCRGDRVKLAETCQLVLFDPTLLSCASITVSSRREEIAVVALAAQHNTRVCGPLCDPRGSSFILPHRSSVFYGFSKHSRSGLQLQTGLQLIQRSSYRAANLQSFAAARHFCSAKILAGGLRWGWGPRRSRQRHRPRKEISRGNLLCAKSGLTNLSYPRPESAQKYVTTPDRENLCTGQPRGARGTAVPLFREESRGTPFQGGSFGQLLRGGSTPRFFSQIRSVGSKPPGWHGTASQPLVLGPQVQPTPLAAGGQQKNRRTFVRRFSLPYLLLYALMPRASRSMARSSLSCLRM